MSSGSSGGSYKNNGSYTYTPIKETTQKKTTSTTEGWKKGLADLGLVLVYSSTLIEDLRLANAIYEDNGKLKWANGWNASNFRQKLSEKSNVPSWWGV